MKLFAIIGFVFLSLSSCKSNKETTVVTQEPCVPSAVDSCVCPANYDPVCGCDNKTYTNACHAGCSNVTYVAGKCKEENK